jgi:hypothetical protein
MKTTKLTLCYVLTWIIAILATVACAGGIFIKDLYQDTSFIKTAWLGNDIVTLTVVLPMLIIALMLGKREYQRAQLVWMGLLAYMVYTYAFYLFGAVFNAFFLLYVLLFSLSVYALVMGLSNLDASGIRKNFSEKTPVNWLGVYLLSISLPLGFFEVGQCLSSILGGNMPAAPTLIFALDLSIVVPNTALAAILLFRRHAWGYILAAMMLIKAFTYGVVLSFSTALIADFSLSATWDPLISFYLFVALGGLIGSIVLLGNLKQVITSIHYHS